MRQETETSLSYNSINQQIYNYEATLETCKLNVTSYPNILKLVHLIIHSSNLVLSS